MNTHLLPGLKKKKHQKQTNNIKHETQKAQKRNTSVYGV